MRTVWVMPVASLGVPGGPVDRVGVGLPQHQAHAGPGHDDVDHLGAGLQVGGPAAPQAEPDRRQRAANGDVNREEDEQSA